MSICNACRLSWKDSTAQRKYVEAVVVGTRAIDIRSTKQDRGCLVQFGTRILVFTSERLTGLRFLFALLFHLSLLPFSMPAQCTGHSWIFGHWSMTRFSIGGMFCVLCCGVFLF